MKTRKKRWFKHNTLKPERPLILCFPEGSWCEIISERELLCNNKKLREWEKNLRKKIYWWKHIRDDNVLEPWFDLNWVVDTGYYGIEIKYKHGENRGSYKWDPPIKNINNDFEKLNFRKPDVNRKETENNIELANNIFGDILPPRIRGHFWWTNGLTFEAIKLIGLENFMLYMYDQPENIHKLMKFLKDEHMNFIRWFEKEGLLSHNNENDYIGSGGIGYTDELPKSDWKKEDNVRLKDMWGFAESQETVGISPDMFREFIIPYQIPLLKEYGLNCYGCCEPVHERINSILQMPNIRRISVSPWCDQEIMADKLQKDYIFSRKPNPSQICVSFDEDQIRKDIYNTLKIANNNVVEIIMKDIHTVQNQPCRIKRWVEIALDEVYNQQ